MKLFKRHFVLQFFGAGAFFLSFSALFAQSDPSGERRVTGTYAITNTTIFTSPGSVTRGHLILRDGLIERIGKTVSIPKDAIELKGDSLFVYPGFIDAGGDAGVRKPETPDKPKDSDPSNPPPAVAGIRPETSVLDDFDPQNEEIEEWRKQGFTISQLLPKGDGMLPGKTAVVLFGNKTSSNILTPSAGMVAKFQRSSGTYPGTILGIMAKWRDLYQNAELAASYKSVFDNNKGVYPPGHDAVLAAFFPVINNQTPVIFQTGDDLEMLRALSLQKEKGFRLILTQVDEGTSYIPRIRESKAEIALSLSLPKETASERKLEEATEEAQKKLERVKDAYEKALQLPSVYEASGIAFAFGTQSTKPEDFLKNLRLMVENGLSEEAALAALTINAARMLDLESTAGSIETGKLANLVIMTDSLFKKDAQVKFVFAGGHQYEYETKSGKANEENNDDVLGGAWNYETRTSGGSASGIMQLSRGADGYQGTISFDNPEGDGTKTTKMRNLEWDGRTLKFDFDVNVQGMVISVSVSGEVSGTEYKGKLTITDLGDFPFSATKSPDTLLN